MDVALPFVIIALIVGTVGFFIWNVYRLARIRREAIETAANEMGLSFFADGSIDTLTRFASFKLFGQGRSRKMMNLIQGDSGEVTISIFDYSFTTGSGKNSQTHYQTVVAIESQSLECPDFTMRPQNLFDRFGSLLGLQDIDFDSHPEFSKLFVLKSSQEEAIRAYFKPALLEFFESKAGISVEALPGAMIFYRSGRYAKPIEFKDQLAQAYEIFGVMVDRS